MTRPPYAMVFAELAAAAGLSPGIITVQGQALLPLHPEHMVWRGRLSRRGGWRMLPGGVNCARPGRWGNPYRVGVDAGDAAGCVALFALALQGIGPMPLDYRPWRNGLVRSLVERHREHGYIVLYCWCKLGDPCHCHPLADALAKELERIVK